MSCIRCEVTRAKIVCAAMALAGKKPPEIAAYLTETLDGKYWVNESLTVPHDYVFRDNNVPPHQPYYIGKANR